MVQDILAWKFFAFGLGNVVCSGGYDACVLVVGCALIFASAVASVLL